MESYKEQQPTHSETTSSPSPQPDTTTGNRAIKGTVRSITNIASIYLIVILLVGFAAVGYLINSTIISLNLRWALTAFAFMLAVSIELHFIKGPKVGLISLGISLVVLTGFYFGPIPGAAYLAVKFPPESLDIDINERNVQIVTDAWERKPLTDDYNEARAECRNNYEACRLFATHLVRPIDIRGRHAYIVNSSIVPYVNSVGNYTAGMLSNSSERLIYNGAGKFVADCSRTSGILPSHYICRYLPEWVYSAWPGQPQR